MVAAAVQYVYNYQVDIHQYAKKEEEKKEVGYGCSCSPVYI